MELPVEDGGTTLVAGTAAVSKTVVIEKVVPGREELRVASIDWLSADDTGDAVEVVVRGAGASGCAAVGEAVDGLKDVVLEKKGAALEMASAQ
jgi:hypothetical protein